MCAAGSRAWSKNWESPGATWINSLHLVFFFSPTPAGLQRFYSKKETFVFQLLSWNHFLWVNLNTEAGTVQEFRVEKGGIQPVYTVFTLCIQARETNAETNAGSAHTHKDFNKLLAFLLMVGVRTGSS